MELKDTPEEERLRLLVSAVTDYAIYMLDPEGYVATWNPGAEKFKGYSRDEIIGEHFSRFYTEEDRKIDFPARALRIAAREGRFEAEGWRVRKDGERFWAHVIIDPVRADDGRLLGYAKITRDITDKRVKDQELYESEQRFRLLVQGVKDAAIYMLDPEGRITNWNAGAEAIKGYEAEDIIGQHFSLFYTEEDRARGEPERALKTALREGKYEREAWRVKKDGSLFWANVLLDPITNEAGEHVGFAKITRDVTEKKKAQDKLEEARQALAQSQKLQALGELAGGIAHDFNNVMTVIMGAADFLRRRTDLCEEKRQHYIEAICESGAKATRLTEQLLAFGRRRPIRNEVVDVNVLLDGLCDMLTHTLGSNINLRLDLEKKSLRVEVDPDQLEMALLNAAVNARDAMPKGGDLAFRTQSLQHDGADEVRIDVIDTGSGMSSSVLERAFDPFFTTKPEGEGTGLGLSQIHGFAHQSGGRAEIQSEKARGTTVSVILPRTEKELKRSSAQHARPQSLPQGLRILLVEDNDAVRVFAQDLLEELDCAVLPAGSGEEALTIMANHSVDLVLSDIVMPGMSGLDLASKVKIAQPEIPIVLATGYSEQAAQADKGLPIVMKPYTRQDIAAGISRALDVNESRWRRRRDSNPRYDN